MDGLIREVAEVPGLETFGRVVGIRGLMIEVAGPLHQMSMGSRVSIVGGPQGQVAAEVVGFEGDRALLLPFGPLDGIRMGCRAIVLGMTALCGHRMPG